MTISHFQGHNIETTVYHGTCEIIQGHCHPIICMIHVDAKNDKFWIKVESLDTADHFHQILLSTKDVKYFIKNQEFTVLTEKDSSNHYHKIYINTDKKQGLIMDPMISFEKLQFSEDEKKEDSFID